MGSYLSRLPVRLRRLARNPGGILRGRLRRWLDQTASSSPVRFGVPLARTTTPAALLDAVDLGFSKAVGAGDDYVDLAGALVEPALFALRDACLANGQVLHLLSGKRVLPAEDEDIRAIVNQHSFAALVCDHRQRALERRTINVWKDHGEFYRCYADDIPATVFPKHAPAEGALGQIDTAVRFPIDIVYTWVDNGDPAWRALIAPYRELSARDDDRYGQSDELRYSLRSVFLFAPWVRRIFVFSNCAKPEWLLDSDRVVWVDHAEVIPSEFLPTFNSHAIETFLHLIPDISEHFLYLNDDFMLSQIAHKQDFFTHDGKSISRLEKYGALLNTLPRVEHGDAPEWQHAAVNSAKLIRARFGFLPTRIHRHAPYSLCKSVYARIEADFPEEIRRTRAARFRQNSDVSFTSFLYHHYAAATGQGIASSANAMIVRDTNYAEFQNTYWNRRIAFFCVNDGAGSFQNAGYTAFKREFPAEAFPIKPPWEAW